MTNLFWYGCVVAVGVAALIFTFAYKKSILDLFSFFLATTSLAYLLEVAVLFYLRSYDYKPGVFADPIAESLLGHLLCNGFFWGGFMLLAAAFKLRYYWILSIAAFFMLVEVFFLKKGLYVHYWWKLYFTGIGAAVMLALVKLWLSALRYSRRLLRHITFFLISWLLLAGPSIILLLAGKQHFNIGLVENFYLNDIFLDVPYHLLVSLLLVLFINYRKNPLFKAVPFILILVSDYVLLSLHCLLFFDGWNLFYLAQLRFLCIGLYIVLEKHTLRFENSTVIGHAART